MVNIKKYFFLVLILLICCPVSAQLQRGDKYFNEGEFAKAIPAYERILKNKSDSAVMENLANCYRITKNYKKAEEWYSKTIAANPNCKSIVYFNYGIALRNNGKIDEAKNQLQNYISKNTNSQTAELQVRSIDYVMNSQSQVPLYAVWNSPSLNTPSADLSPLYFQNGLLFISDRGEKDLLNDENSAVSGRAFFSIYYAKKSLEKEDSIFYGKASKFSSVINKEFHTGPISVTASGKFIAFNQVELKKMLKSKKFVNRSKIYFSNYIDRHWSTPSAFQYNSNAYSCAHPALSNDGNLLFFASDRIGDGSVGGMDIWVCKREGDAWSKPENLGPEVNTTADEVFPYLRNDGILFYSSDGLVGMGGLDIFSTLKDTDGKWRNVVNQGAPLNGVTDDFGIIFNADGSRGYFTSNRVGGKGDDDVYCFKVSSKFIRFKGKILTSTKAEEILANTKIELLSKEGRSLGKTTTDGNGNFIFENLLVGQNYLIRLDEKDSNISYRKKYYMMDEKDKLVRVTVLNEVGGRYTFMNIPIDSLQPPQLLSDDDYITVAGNLISDFSPPQPIANTKVELRDADGNVVQTTTTNAFGAFIFTHIPPDKSYIVSISEGIEPRLMATSKILITDKSGKELMSSKPNAKGRYEFKIIKEDKSVITAMTVKDMDLRLDMKGTLVGADKLATALANTIINILDENGNVMQTVKTDDKGQFIFINLPADQSFLVSVEGITDPGLLALGKIFLKDATGKTVKTLLLDDSYHFVFRILPTERNTIGQIYVDDPWLQVLAMKSKVKTDSLIIIENIYYDYAAWNILPGAENTLQKVAKVMQLDTTIQIEISAHTDARANADYNLKLSQKRAQAALDYLAQRGINPKRLTAIGYGETRLLNKCFENVECDEAEHAKNRRTEFKISRNK